MEDAAQLIADIARRGHELIDVILFSRHGTDSLFASSPHPIGAIVGNRRKKRNNSRQEIIAVITDKHSQIHSFLIPGGLRKGCSADWAVLKIQFSSTKP